MEKLKYLSKVPYSICIFDNWQKKDIYKYKECFLVIHDKVYDIHTILIDHNLNDNICNNIIKELTALLYITKPDQQGLN